MSDSDMPTVSMIFLVSVVVLTIGSAANGLRLTSTRLFGTGTSSGFYAASDLSSTAITRLSSDQQSGATRRANTERDLLLPGVELQETNVQHKVLKPSSTKTAKQLMADEWAKVLKSDGVIRLNNCVSKETCTALRAHILREMALSNEDIKQGLIGAREVHGMELERKSRHDYLMSMGPPTPPRTAPHPTNHPNSLNPSDAQEHPPDGSGEDEAALLSVIGPHPVATALHELFGDHGSLRQLYEIIVTKKGVLFELASMTTRPGADRQVIHADMPYQKIPPLYTIFCALQDVSFAMGPTVFLPKTNNLEDNLKLQNKMKDPAAWDAYLAKKTPHFACLKQGDLIVYDPRVLHCGSENQPTSGETEPVTGGVRAMFTVGFRNPKVTGDFGFKGSLRTAYR